MPPSLNGFSEARSKMGGSVVAAKAKAVFGTYLKKADYENLIQRGSISAVVAYLKTTPRYAPVFKDVDENTIHRGTVEELLSEHIFRRYIRLRRFASGNKNGILDFYVRKTEAEQVIKLISAVASGSQQSFYLSMPAHIMDYLSFKPEEAARCKDFKELAVIFEKNKLYKPLIPYLSVEKPDVNKCITVVNSCYLSWAFRAIDSEFRGKKRETLKQFLLKKTDMDNVLLCYRLKKFFDEDEQRIKELMLPCRYRVKPADIDTALKAQSPTAALIALMSEKCVHKSVNIDEDFPELGATQSDYRFFRHRLALTSDETEAIFSLLVIADNERTNLQKIIEGIRYGESPSEIEKLLVI